MNEQGLLEPDAPPHRERLTIGLLMLWTAMSAVWLTLNRRSLVEINDPMLSFWRSLAYWLDCSQALFAGAGLAALVLAAWRFLKGGPRLPSQPGHWLLMIAGVVPLFNFMVWMAPPWSKIIPPWRLIAFVVSESLLLIALKYMAARAQRDHWRWVFWVGIFLTATGLVTGLIALAFPGSLIILMVVNILPWIATISVVVGAGMDIKRRIPRDSLHWAGLAAIIMQQVLDFMVPSLLYFWHAPSAP